MTRIVLTFGIIAGLICAAMFWIMHPPGSEIDFDGGQVAGYATMIIALSAIFFAVRQYRDKHLGGHINFKRSFLVGLYTTLIASLIYVVSWEVYSANSSGDFADNYIEWKRDKLAESGLSAAEIDEKMVKMESWMDMYQNNRAARMAMTTMEIFPVGLIISLLGAFFFGYWQNRGKPTQQSVV